MKNNIIIISIKSYRQLTRELINFLIDGNDDIDFKGRSKRNPFKEFTFDFK